MPRLKPSRDLEGLRRRVVAPSGRIEAPLTGGVVAAHRVSATSPPARAVVPAISLVDALCGETCEKLMGFLDGACTARLGCASRYFARGICDSMG